MSLTLLKLIAFVMAWVIAALVGAHNAKRSFRPPLRSHIELFVAGVPLGFIFVLLILPERAEAAYFAVIGAFLTGLICSFSIPRQWRYWNETRLSKKE